MPRARRRPRTDTDAALRVGLVLGVLCFASACCPPPGRSLPPYEELTMELDASMVRTYGASLSLTSRAPPSEVPVLLAGESVAIHLELSPAAQDVLVTVALRSPDDRAMVWSSGVPPEHDVRIEPWRGRPWSGPLELDVGAFVPDLEGARSYCAVVELDVVRGDVMRRRAACGTTELPLDEDLKGMAPGDWTRIAQPVLVAIAETPAGSADAAQWEQLASQSERCATDAAASD